MVKLYIKLGRVNSEDDTNSIFEVFTWLQFWKENLDLYLVAKGDKKKHTHGRPENLLTHRNQE